MGEALPCNHESGLCQRPEGHVCEGNCQLPMSREELKEIMQRAIADANFDAQQLAELYDLSKTDLFSKEGGEIVREVIEAEAQT